MRGGAAAIFATITTLGSAAIALAACSLGAFDGYSNGSVPTDSGSQGSESGATGPDGASSSGSSSGSSGSADDDGGPGDSGSDAPITGDDYRVAVMQDAPIGYWRLGETSGLTAKDEVGAHPGGYQGSGFALGAPAKVTGTDTALALDGTSGYVSIGDVLDFNGNVPISLEAWVNLDVIDADYKRVITKRVNGGGYSLFCQTNSAGCAFELIGGGKTIVCEMTLTIGQWYHIVGTYDGMTARGYRDGVQVCTDSDAITFAKVNANLVIGSYSGGGNYFKGKLDEIAVYDKALSAARVSAHSLLRKP